MKEEEKEIYNKWQAETGKKPLFSQIATQPIEAAAILLNDREIMDEIKAQKIALDFVLLLCDYLTKAQIRDIDENGYNKTAVKLFYSLKEVIDNGFLLFKEKQNRGQNLTETRVKKQAEQKQKQAAKEEEKKADQQRQFDEMFDKLS